MQFRLRSSRQCRVARCCEPIQGKSTTYKLIPITPRNTAATRRFIFRSRLLTQQKAVTGPWNEVRSCCLSKRAVLPLRHRIWVIPRLGPYLDAPRSRSHVPGTPHEISRHRIYRRSRYRTATLEMGGRSDPPKRPRRDQIRGGSRSRASDRPGAGSQKAKANPAYARALMAVQNEKPRLQGGPQAGQKSQVGHSANADAERRCPNYIRQIENGKRKTPPGSSTAPPLRAGGQ